MFSGKKISISLLATLVAVPNLAFGVPTKVTKTTTTTKTTTSASKGSGGVITAEDKKDLKMIGIAAGVGGVLALVARYGLYNLYKSCGGPEDMQTFFKKADLKAKEQIQDQDAMNKKTSKLDYKPLTDDQKDKITQDAFEGYFTDKSANLFGLEPAQFKSWFNSLGSNGANLSDRIKVADIVIRQLAVDSDLAIPYAKAGELPFQSAVRYAVKEGVVTRPEASARVETFVPRSTPDTSGSTASRMGRVARGVVNAAGEAASDAARGVANAGKSIASGVASAPDYANQFRRGYVAADQSGSAYNRVSAAENAADRVVSVPQVDVQYQRQLRAGMASAQASQSAASNMAKELEARQATAQVNADDKVDPTVDTAEGV